jgi:hypothetical protein
MSLEEALKIPGLVLTWEKTSSRLGMKGARQARRGCTNRHHPLRRGKKGLYSGRHEPQPPVDRRSQGWDWTTVPWV